MLRLCTNLFLGLRTTKATITNSVSVQLAMMQGYSHEGRSTSSLETGLHCKRCGVIYDTVECLPHLFWCVCHFHSVIYYTNSVVFRLHFLQCIGLPWQVDILCTGCGSSFSVWSGLVMLLHSTSILHGDRNMRTCTPEKKMTVFVPISFLFSSIASYMETMNVYNLYVSHDDLVLVFCIVCVFQTSSSSS